MNAGITGNKIMRRRSWMFTIKVFISNFLKIRTLRENLELAYSAHLDLHPVLFLGEGENNAETAPQKSFHISNMHIIMNEASILWLKNLSG